MKRQNRVAFFNILSTVLLNGISILTGPLFSRLLGASGYGVLKIYNIWVSVITVLLTLQTQSTLVNARVEYPEETQKRYQSSVLSLSVLVFLGGTALVAVFLGPISRLLKMDPALIWLMLLQAFGTFCVNFLNTKYTYEFKAGRNMLISLVVTLVTLGLSLVLILNLPQDLKYYGRIVSNAAVYGLMGIPICIGLLLQGRCLYNREFWRFCVVLAVPAVFHNLSDLVLGQSDMVMLQQMLGTDAAGQYGYAWQLANFLFVLFGALNRTWCPFFFEEEKEGKREAMMAKTRNFLELFTILACGFMLLAPEVYHVYARWDFWDSTMVIPLFVGSYYLNFLCTFPVNYEYYHRKTNVVAAVTIFSSLVNIVLNYLLIRAMGMAGAAVATMTSHGIQLLLHHGYTRFVLGKEDYPFPLGVWAKYALAFAAIMAVVFLTEKAWLLRWGIGALLGLWELLQIRKRKVLI